MKDILAILDRLPIWKRLHKIPDEVDQLKARVDELERMRENRRKIRSVIFFHCVALVCSDAAFHS